MVKRFAQCQNIEDTLLRLINKQRDYFVLDILYSVVKLTRELAYSHTGDVSKYCFFCRTISLFFSIYGITQYNSLSPCGHIFGEFDSFFSRFFFFKLSLI